MRLTAGFLAAITLTLTRVQAQKTMYSIGTWCRAAAEVTDENPNCENYRRDHVVCRKNAVCDPVPECEVLIPTRENRVFIQTLHNDLRNRIALGTDDPEKLQVANMMSLSWDDDLEFLAQCHASDCPSGPDMCRALPPGYLAGQNYHFTGQGSMTLNQISEDAMYHWKIQIELIHEDDYSSYKSHEDENFDDFAQMVWAETDKIGCAWTRNAKYKNTEYEYAIWCNYAPSGNIEGSPVFIRGKVLTKCPQYAVANVLYKGLCGETVYPEEEEDSTIGHRPSYIIVGSACYALIFFLQ